MMPTLLAPALLALLPMQQDLVWLAVPSGTDQSLRGLCAVDGRTAWIAGAAGTVLRATEGALPERVPVPGAEELDFRSVHAFDAERALLVSAGTPARIYRTEDGGKAWQLVHEDPREGAFFDGIHFRDERHGMVFGDPIDGRLVILTTDDGGKTFVPVPAAGLPPALEGEAGFAASGSSLRLFGETQAAVGLGGPNGARVLRSDDAGATWSAVLTPLRTGSASRGIFSLCFFEGGEGVAVGGDYTALDETQAVAARTSDGGRSWTLVDEAPPSGYRSSVTRLAHGGELIAVGPGGCDVSRDNGRSWTRFSDQGFHSVSATPDGAAWASGAEGRIARLVLAMPAPGDPTSDGTLGAGDERDEPPLGVPIRGERVHPPADEAGTAGSAWNRFRGPNGTGLGGPGDYPERIGPQTNVLWTRAFPEGHSSPVLSAERLFLTGVEDERLFTYAVDRASGATVWKREAPRPRRTRFHADNHPAAASPAVDGDTIVVFFDEYGLLAYDHAGEERWRLPLGPFDNIYGMGASPILVDGVCVLACDQATQSFVLGVSAQSGEELWRTPRERAVSGHCTPVVRRPQDGPAEVLLPGSFLLDAYDATSGERLWWMRGLPSEMKSVPVLLGDTLFVHGFASPLNNQGNQIELPPFAEAIERFDADADGGIAAAELPDERARPYFPFLDLDGDGALLAHEWDYVRDSFSALNAALAMKPGGRGDITGEALLWQYFRDIPQLPSPLVTRDTYFMLGDQGGLLTLLDPASGERRSKERLPLGSDSYYASPVSAGGLVYLLSRGGELCVVSAESPYEVLHTASFDDAGYATPALDAGRVYLRTGTALWCFGRGATPR